MAQTRTVVVLVLVSLAMGVLVGLGVAGSGAPPGRSSASGIFGPQGPLGVPGGVLPALPPGVSVDERGVLTGAGLAPAPGTTMLGWDTLRSFEYSAAVGLGAPGAGELPDAVKAVDGQRVTMLGFLMPNYEYDDIQQFALVGSHWSCCFGYPAGINGTVNVTLAKGHKGMSITFEPLRVVGTFRAKEIKEEGWLVAIYSLEDATAELLK